jgi:hypothetical protein
VVFRRPVRHYFSHEFNFISEFSLCPEGFKPTTMQFNHRPAATKRQRGEWTRMDLARLTPQSPGSQQEYAASGPFV